jgi:hypothetical protein
MLGEMQILPSKEENAARLSYQAVCRAITVASAHEPNKSFNADANTGHAFGILLASVGALRPDGLRRRLTRALGSRENKLWNCGLCAFALRW